MSDLKTYDLTRSSQDSLVSCKVCEAPFDTLQDCLGHELLKHTFRPQKKVRKWFDAVTKMFDSEQTQRERRELMATIAQAQPGQELRALVGYYAGNCNELAACYNQVRETLQKQLQGTVKVYPFGSLVTGLALRDSDIDLFLEQVSNIMSHRQLFNKVNSIMRRSNCFQDIIAIRNARVPILRCKHVQSGLSLDINMSSPNSTYNSRFVAELLNRDVRIRELFLFLKIWAKKLKLIGSGSMTSYCLATLIIFAMQQQRQLPSIKQLQEHCRPVEVMGVNYAYSLQHVRPLPASLTSLDLIHSFFELYSQMEFRNKLLSPYLGYALDLETAFSAPGPFPEYEAQLEAMQRATGEQPEPFQNLRCVCVQDPFELQHNVGQSISQTNLCYLRDCIALAAKAFNDKKLLSTPDKLYDYLLFGLAEKLLEEQRMEHLHPAKQRRQVGIKGDQHSTPRPVTAATAKPTVVATSIKADAATPKPAAAASTADTLPSSSIDMIFHILKPTNNDIKSLRTEFLSKNLNGCRPIYYYWVECYVEAIKDIMQHIYSLNMHQIDTEQPSQADGLPHQMTWLISTTVDTWSSRDFQRNSKQSFFAQQLQQTIDFLKTRSQCESYAVNLKGRFSLISSSDYKELRLELHPMPGDATGLLKHGPLTKFFKSLKNMLLNYNFKEKVISLKFER